ncbi:glycoside hydrolase family 27 protein [Nakamurella lactea]|uniref:glycoside hydrolase family 27 protein n=1 Tax=Nakamurella lactea TaxID=459515 RepID=UPI00042991AF|nr:alpha-galactosidase [Nakamurella lactea]
MTRSPARRLSRALGVIPLFLGLALASAGAQSSSAAVLETAPVVHVPLGPLFDNVGLTSVATRASGNFDGSGNSFAAQKFAELGITPGSTVATDPGGPTYIWPDYQPADPATDEKPDNVRANGQVVPVNASGAALSVLAAASANGISGSLTVTYTDGTSEEISRRVRQGIGIPNWGDLATHQADPEAFGARRVGGVAGRNTQGGYANTDYEYSLYSKDFPLDPAKTVASLTLPSNTSYHVFAVSVLDQAPPWVGGLLSEQSLIVSAPPVIAPGSSARVRVSMTNASAQALSSATADLTGPAGISVRREQAMAGTIKAGAVGTAIYRVSVPRDREPGDLSWTATASSSGGQLTADAASIVPFGSVGAAFNNVGTTEFRDRDKGDLDGAGSSLRREALKAAKTKPGAKIQGGQPGLDYRWPDSRSGKPDNIAAGGQTIALDATGKRGLGLLGTSTAGGDDQQVLVHYDDGVTAKVSAITPNQAAFPDWTDSAADADNDYAAQPALVTSGRNTASGVADRSQRFTVFSRIFPIDPTKHLMAVTLPTDPNLHIFDIAVSTVAAKADTGLDRTIAASLAPTPPMGFNDWLAYGCNVSESLMKSAADQFVTLGLKDLGYQYINIDDCWANRSRDGSGRLTVDTAKFPSGMASLADYVHGKGLKVGIYSAASVQTCGGYPASLGLFNQDFNQFADWNMDYIKLDLCGSADNTLINSQCDTSKGLKDVEARYKSAAEALADIDRPMLLAVSAPASIAWWCGYDGAIYQDAASWAWKYGQLARVEADSGNSWVSLLRTVEQNARIADYQQPGFWNDEDMLAAGHAMSNVEQQTQFIMFAQMAAPLLVSTNPAALAGDQDALAILKNADVIAVDQDSLGVQGRVTSSGDGWMVMTKPLSNGDVSVVLFNSSDAARVLTADARQVGLGTGPVTDKDLVSKQSATAADGSVSASLAPHQAKMFRVTRG